MRLWKAAQRESKAYCDWWLGVGGGRHGPGRCEAACRKDVGGYTNRATRSSGGWDCSSARRSSMLGSGATPLIGAFSAPNSFIGTLGERESLVQSRGGSA